MPPLVVTYVSPGSTAAARLMISSLRRFGGSMADSAIWIFTADPKSVIIQQDEFTRLVPLDLPVQRSRCLFLPKVCACARAEELSPSGTRSLVWIDPNILVVQPPLSYDLGPGCDAAYRPVHIRNIGLPPNAPLDAFWQGILDSIGVPDIKTSVTSFVDDQALRTYFNTHAFSIDPGLGLLRMWRDLFLQLDADSGFQSTACQGELHQIFLFQALLSALVASRIPTSRLLILPPTYNYPLHLQLEIPISRRLEWLNDAISLAYENLPLQPGMLAGIKVREPLLEWLNKNVQG